MKRLLVSILAASLLATGAAQALPACETTRLEVKTPPLTAEPFVDLRVDGRTGPWLLDFGATDTTVSPMVWRPANGETTVRLADLGLPGISGGPRVYPATSGSGAYAGVGLQQGTIGTDLLAQVTTELHFEDANDPHVVIAAGPCPGPKPDRNFFRIAQTDFFGARPPTHAGRRANVPVVFIALEARSVDVRRPDPAAPRRIGRTWAQIDTGYADTYWPFSVDINEAYLKELERRTASLVIVGLVHVTGCGAEDSVRAVYAAPGWRLAILNDRDERLPGRSFDGFYLVVKPVRTRCGGIGPLAEPAAQLGSSFLRAFGTTIFMPATAEVWIKPP